MAKSAIITGASRGIGRSIAKRLASDGFNVVVNYAGNTAEAESAVNEIKAAGGTAIAIQADIADQAQVEQLFAKTKEAFGQVDVVVNNAGVLAMSAIEKGDLDAFDQIIRTNLRGTYVVFSEAAKNVVNGGRIIGFSSTVLSLALPNYGPYIASKAAVEGLVHVLANELRGRNITVNAVAPGPVATELFLKGKSEELIAHFSKQPPLERLGQPGDIANVVSFLAGPDGSWINSQVHRANGGLA